MQSQRENVTVYHAVGRLTDGALFSCCTSLQFRLVICEHQIHPGQVSTVLLVFFCFFLKSSSMAPPSPMSVLSQPERLQVDAASLSAQWHHSHPVISSRTGKNKKQMHTVEYLFNRKICKTGEIVLVLSVCSDVSLTFFFLLSYMRFTQFWQFCFSAHVLRAIFHVHWDNTYHWFLWRSRSHEFAHLRIFFTKRFETSLVVI